MWEVSIHCLDGFPTCMGDISEWRRDKVLFFSCIIQHLLGDHACAGATSSKWSVETAIGVAVGHRDDVLIV